MCSSGPAKLREPARSRGGRGGVEYEKQKTLGRRAGVSLEKFSSRLPGSQNHFVSQEHFVLIFLVTTVSWVPS